MDWHQLWTIASAPDNVPIVAMLFLVPFFTWLGIRQARRNDRLIEQLEADPGLAKTHHRKFEPWRPGWAKVPFADVDDLVQDTFIKALRGLSGLRENRRFGPWLATIARNLANDHYRHAAPETPLEEEVAFDKLATAPASEMSAATVLEAIKNLPDAYREPLMLRLVEGMTGPEIAARTGLTPGEQICDGGRPL